MNLNVFLCFWKNIDEILFTTIFLISRGKTEKKKKIQYKLHKKAAKVSALLIWPFYQKRLKEQSFYILHLKKPDEKQVSKFYLEVATSQLPCASDIST